MSVAEQMMSEDGEVRRLISLAQSRNDGSRQHLYGAVADLFERRGEDLGDGERQIMIDILERLSREVEMAVRKRLADRLAMSGSAPVELVRLLANDDIDVARPVLENSPVLRDSDLIDVIRQRTKQHQLAVAIRHDVSEDVSAALVDTGNEDVIVTLLNNHDARISSSVLAYLAEEAKRVDAFQKPLVHRPDLPDAVAERMYVWVSAEVKQFILQKFDIDASALDQEIAGAVADAMVDNEDSQKAAENLVDQLFDVGELSVDFILRALQQGQVGLFERGFAKYTGLDYRGIDKVIYGDSGQALATACQAVGFSRSQFLRTYQLTRKANQRGTRLSKDDTVRLCRLFDGISREAASLTLRRWQRGTGYAQRAHA
jgi:uncharacterized protein (DUF2336 family)